MRILLSLLILFTFSCSTVEKKEECKEVNSRNNLGPNVNSTDSESLISTIDNQIVFRQSSEDEFNIFQLSNNEILLTRYNQIIKNLKIDSPGLPTLYQIKDGEKIMVVSGLLKDTLNRDLSAYRIIDDFHTTNINCDILNSEGFEGHPYFDGNRLYFTKEIDSGWDIYYSDLVDNTWTSPKPMFEINTLYDEGFYHNNNNLELFSRRDKDKKFSIWRNFINNDNSEYYRKLSTDINSDFNDISATLVNNKVFFSSDRPGGCGEFDLYSADFCSNVKLNGIVVSEFEDIPLTGSVSLYNVNNILIDSVDIDNADFEFLLSPNEYYYLKYNNECYSSEESTKLFYAECNELENVVIIQEIVLPDYTVEFNFEEYDIPFFVTGYYRPNTTENLSELKKLFKHNVIKGKENTSYIEYPSEKYHDYSYVIDSAFDSAVLFIEEQLQNLNNECISNNIKLAVDITGYSDPRPIGQGNIYPGPDVHDSEGSVVFSNGDQIDNEKLSFLRAYYTGEYIKSKIKSNNNIIYNVFTGGVKSESNLPNDLKRKVKISIRLQK